MYLQTKSFLLEFFTKSKSDRSKMQFLKMITIQESPPARNRTRHTARGVTCPGEGGSPILSWLGEEGFPSSVLAWGGYPSAVLARGVLQSCPGQGVPQDSQPGLGTPWPGLGYPPSQLGLGYPTPPPERAWDQRP